MFKAVVFVCVVLCVFVEARPKWQYLPAVPGYVPVYIRTGDTPLEEINPDLAEAFHALPAGRSASKQLEANPEIPEAINNKQDEDIPEPEENIDRRPYEKKLAEKKKKTGFSKPIQRR